MGYQFSMLSTCAEFSADQNGGFPQANSINLGDMCLFVSLCKISHIVLWGKEGWV